ncbi:hypothetical protein FACS18948_3330 [Clostridia bacterium]|nr:hypothetical protein FACS18948_3330 [Clostridia bacterium]
MESVGAAGVSVGVGTGDPPGVRLGSTDGDADGSGFSVLGVVEGVGRSLYVFVHAAKLNSNKAMTVRHNSFLSNFYRLLADIVYKEAI